MHRPKASEAREAGIMAGSTAESFAPSAKLRAPGQLLSVLKQRGLAIDTNKPSAGSVRAAQGAQANKSAGKHKPNEAGASGSFWSTRRAGVIALLIGAAAFIVLLLMTSVITGAPLRIFAVLFALAG